MKSNVWAFWLTGLLPFYCFSDPTPLSLEDLARISHVVTVHMSPNGKHIAVTLNKASDPYLHKHPTGLREMYLADKKGRLKPFLTGGDGIAQVQWSKDNRFIWFLGKRLGDRHAAIYRIPVDGGEARKFVQHKGDISGFSISHDQQTLVFWAQEEPDFRSMALKKQGFDAQVFEEDEPKEVLWMAKQGKTRWSTEVIYRQQHVLMAQLHPKADRILLQSAPSSLTDQVTMHKQLSLIDFRGQVEHSFNHVGKMGKARLSPNGRYVAVIGTNDPHDPAEGRLLIGDMKSSRLIDLLPEFDGHIEDIAWLSKHNLGFIGHQGTGSFLGTKRADKTPGKHRIKLANVGVLSQLSASDNGGEIALINNTANHPDEAYWHNNRATVRVTNSNAWLAARQLPKQKVMEYTSRDGIKLQGILVAPLKTSNRPAPLLMFVHGGPESHVSDGWLNRYTHPAAYAAGKGYMSFFPNYRGSTGRGVAFSKLGQRDYAGAEFNDLLDAKAFLVKQGLADRDRSGISGASYGGYAAAWAATRHTEHFAASVAGMGISNQISKFGTTDIPTEMYQLHARKWPWEDWQWMLERSPLHYTQQTSTPLLLLHGLQDKRVPASQSVELYRHLKVQNKVQVRLVLYPNDGHGFQHSSARLDYSMRLMRWMDHFLLEAGKKPPTYHLPHPQFTPENSQPSPTNPIENPG